MADRPLTDLQRRVLRAMAELEKDWRRHAHTPNEIGLKAGARTVRSRGMGSGRGRGHRTFGPAQQIIFTLTSLDRRGLIRSTERDDLLSGSAYLLTGAGRKAADDV